MTPSHSLADRIIIALDLPDLAQARALVDEIGDQGRFYKIGYQLMPLGGYELARELSAAGKRVFIDAKFHDIGATVEKGTRSVAALGADILTVHAEEDVLKGAVAGRGEDERLKIFAVTVLTSLDQGALARAGVEMKIGDLVLRRAELAAEAGADGVIASPHEARAIRERFGNRLMIATPGVRPPGAPVHDQKRVASPAEAFADGADLIVIGRPITADPDPRGALARILASVENA